MQPTIRSKSLIAGMFSSFLFLLALTGEATEPVGWRNDGSGCFANCQPPTSWSAENHLRWKKDLSGSSMSSPVVVGDYVFTMVEPTELICLRADDGSIAWRRTHNYADVFPPEKVREIETQHAAAAKIRQRIEQLQKQLTEVTKSDPASTEKQTLEADIASLQKQYDDATPFPPATTDGGTGNTTGTPVSNGRAVWSAFATGIVSSHELDGNRNWMQFLEKPTARHTASPVLAGNRLIVHFKNLIALDADDGHVLWRAETPARNGTPVVTRVGTSELIVTPAGSVIGVPDGQILAEKLFDLAYCSPIVHDGVVYAIERGATKAIQLSADGKALTTKILWETRGAEDDRLASPVVHQELLYSISGKGILEVVEADSGERVYRKRLDLGQGRADPSLAIAGDFLFVSSNSGRTLVLKPGREYEEISRNELEGFSSSPFFNGECTYIRTAKHLYCIGQ
jgi:outer membrane protein assembly factor BamB